MQNGQNYQWKNEAVYNLEKDKSKSKISKINVQMDEYQTFTW